MNQNTTTEAFFEAKYRESPDPWDFSTSVYENSRYDATIEALGSRQFTCAFEPGCSIGVLTKRLTQCCDSVYANDISATVVEEAKRRCRGMRAVISQGALPEAIPVLNFDLIVFSEIGYYFDLETLGNILDRLIVRLHVGGIFLGVHWTGHSDDHVLSGELVHQVIESNRHLKMQTSQRHEGFVLGRWERV